ncbi:MAG: hypothetical protein HY474_02255 [Candidatus Sungbacteria bacterium]|uniref:Prepilin-type N-terminal cleavage/methylation domain-containing protein n=1 Tax=Candidatus Sungiibacteriota bacterium TaxID=2750080 RepID=A0A933DT20_9BACT|nr:hypothetical protein [Candidatus Sungbacteria bacterium]
MNPINRPPAPVNAVTTGRFHRAKRFIVFTERSDSSFSEGFTLLEMVVSFGIFAVVIVTAIGAVIAISNAQVKAANTQNVQDNLRFALESMTKEMRTGRTFAPSGGNPPAYAALTFLRSDGVQVTYCSRAGALRKVTGANTDCAAGSDVTSDAVTVEQLVFYIVGQAAGASDGQPRITVALRASSSDRRFPTTFRLQTTIVQRERDQ